MLQLKACFKLINSFDQNNKEELFVCHDKKCYKIPGSIVQEFNVVAQKRKKYVTVLSIVFVLLFFIIKLLIGEKKEFYLLYHTINFIELFVLIKIVCYIPYYFCIPKNISTSFIEQEGMYETMYLKRRLSQLILLDIFHLYRKLDVHNIRYIVPSELYEDTLDDMRQKLMMFCYCLVFIFFTAIMFSYFYLPFSIIHISIFLIYAVFISTLIGFRYYFIYTSIPNNFESKLIRK